MMAFWSPEAVARAARFDPDPHGFIRAAADLIGEQLQRLGVMPHEQAQAWRAQVLADATRHLADTSQAAATAPAPSGVPAA